jgi:hypothetical protein
MVTAIVTDEWNLSTGAFVRSMCAKRSVAQSISIVFSLAPRMVRTDPRMTARLTSAVT